MSAALARESGSESFVRLIFPWVVSLLLIGFFGLVGNGTVCSILKIAVLLYSIFANLDSLFYGLLIFAPNDSMLLMSGFISLTSAIAVIYLFRALISYKYTAKIDKSILLFGILLCLVVLVRFSITNENYFTGSVKIVISFLVIAVYCDLKQKYWNRSDVFRLLLAFIYGCVVMTVLSYLNFYFFDLNYDRLRPVNGDPNYLSLYLCVCISLIVLWIFEIENEKSVILLLSITACFLFVAGLLSQSRGFIVAFVPASVYLCFQIPKHFGKNPLLVGLFVILIFVVGYVITSGQDNLLEDLIDRFTAKETSGGSGRTAIWISYIDAWLSDLIMFLFGVPQTALVGAASAELRFKVSLGVFIAVHNLYLELLCQLGVMFSICFTAIIARLSCLMPKIRGFWRNIPLIALLLGYCFLSGALSVTLPFLFFVSWLGSSFFVNRDLWSVHSFDSCLNVDRRPGDV